MVVTGFLVGELFLVNAPFLFQRRRYSLMVLFCLALFDFAGEFIAQGTLVIDITLSFVVATIILVILVFYGRRL
ncbi:MAG TPA: hypothetical protein VI451_12820 [Anaerolineales bacterium]|nr:hypothetical protein [Anaerolineales bacterium]